MSQRARRRQRQAGGSVGKKVRAVFGAIFALIGIAAASALVEAVSPHGWDNLPMQLIPSALAWAWLA